MPRRALLTVLAAAAATILAPAAVASAKVTEVGLIENTKPATVPSCTAGPLGSASAQLEAEAKAPAPSKPSPPKASKKRKRSSTHHSRHRVSAHKSSAERVRSRSTRRWRRLSLALPLDDGGLEAAIASAHLASMASASSTATSTESTPSTSTPSTSTTTTSTTTTSTPATTEAPCLAVSQTTGIQVKVNHVNNPLVIPIAGRIVAWTIELGRPTEAQTKFFDENEGGPASAGIALLSPVKHPQAMYHLLAQSPLVKLEPYFGMTAQFPLAQTIQVKKGDVVGLTVPTWAPALALGFGKNTSWRASRQKSECSATSTQTAQTTLKSNIEYYCLYQTARLTFSATLISTP